ncbi:chemotaxis protein CheW [Rubrivivax sp. RP6-9]|uniref:chemotaxis protein CheW n=1 Tax=Rubrivivax sp. RP6-9 TaxID=3415750 RepID=UPI003CC594C6
MANREALRELQSRLAQRLQAARTEARSVAWLAVECAGQGLLVALPAAGEIFPLGTLLPVPHTQPWFAGVANLRGGLHGVVDLAGFLGMRPTLSAPDAVREHAQLLALNANLGSHCALLIEKLAGLRSAEQMTAEPADGSLRPAFAGGRWRDAEGRVWQELDLQALAQDEQFLGIAA